MIWIISLGVLAVIGSVLMLKPSARDSRLAALRFDAIKIGLQVRQFQWQPDPVKTGVQEGVMATSYSLMRPGTNKPGDLRFVVVARKGWDTEGLPEGFSWHRQGSAADAQQLQTWLPQLQDQLLLLEVRENQVLLMAAEQSGASAAAYQHFLEQFLRPA